MGLLDIIIPVLNEEGNVTLLVQRLHTALSAAGIKYRLIFVDDHSRDSTLHTLNRLAARYPIVIHTKVGKPGKAFSVLEGAALAETEYVAMIDGDLQYPPEAIPQMLRVAQTQHHSVVVANRRIAHSSPVRHFVSRSNRLVFSRFLLGLNCDVQSGLKVFRRELLPHLFTISLNAWALDMPLLHTAVSLGGTIGTVDIEFAQRTSGKSKINLVNASWQIGYQAVKLRLSPPAIYSIPGKSPESALGTGVIHRKQTFITHTKLSHDQSAIRTLVGWQKIFLFSVLFILSGSLVLAPHTTLLAFVGGLSVLYFADTLFNLFIVLKSLDKPAELSFTVEQLNSLDKKNLPVYSILCPLYREAAVLPAFVESISSLVWPKDKLDVLLLLEENDTETIAAARELSLPPYFRVIIVPHSQPKTKPKACNYGLAFVKGEYVVIYDAEDKPDPFQLKKAYLGFQSSPKNVSCLQAKLNYYNPHHNLLTRFFTIEYSLWFDITLPGLQSINTTIPLGGTSNHFKTDILRELQGWDAFNVTEDCDLGARLFKHGYRTAIIDSVTLEEANSRVGNWLRQRSRWIKGYIQTYLVHNRHPVRFFRSQGWHALIFQLVVGGKIAFMVINPILWLMTIAYFTLYKFVGPAIESFYPPLIFYMASFSLVFGNFLFMYYYMLGSAKRGHWELVKYVYLIPLYWLLISLASAKAWYQLIVNPHYWEKTKHGLQDVKSPRFNFVWPVLPRIKLPSLPVFPPAFTGGSILVFSAGFVNVINLAYNLLLSRSISVEQLGIMGLLGSFVYFTQVPFSALSQSVTHRSAYLLGKFQFPARSFWSNIRRRTLIISLVCLVVWTAGVPWLSAIFHLGTNFLPLFVFTPVLVLGALSAVDRGFLGGNLRFSTLAFMSLSEAILKLGMTYVCIYFHRIDLLYFVFPVSLFISFLIGWISSSRFPSVSVIPDKSNYFPVQFFTTSILTGIASVSFLTLDTILAKIFLSPTQAGLYILLSLAGKMVFFAGSLFSQFILPVISLKDGRGHNTQKPFYQIMLASGLSSLLGFVVVGAYGNVTMPFLFGPKAVPLAPYLPWYAVSMVFFSLASGIVNYHQAKKQYSLSFISLFFALFLPLGMFLFHQDIATLVAVVVAVSSGQLVSVLFFHFFAPRKTVVSTWSMRDLFEVLSPKSPPPSSGNSIRILIFNWRDTKHSWAGGAEVYIQEIAKRWVEMGVEVTLFCGNDGGQSRNDNLDGVKIIRRGGTYLVYLWAFLYYIFRFRGQYDFVIDCENGIPFFTPLYVGVPKLLLIHHVHQNVFREHLGFPLSQIGVFLETKLMPLVYRHQQVITVSESSKQDILALGFVKADSISIINPGVSGLQLTSLTPKTSYPSFVYLGRIRPYKNVDIAIRAFAEIVKDHPSAQLSIAGTGENLSELQRLVSELRLENSIRFLGRVTESEKVRLLSASWAMLQPSSFEGWGITVIEANACSTPVIASNVIGLRDSVLNNRTGILVPAKDVIALTAAIKALILLPDYRRRLSRAALAWSRTFDWDVNAGEFFSVISQNLSNSNRQIPLAHIAYAKT